HSVSAARHDPGGAPARLPRGAPGILLLAEHPRARAGSREPQQRFHVAEFLSHQRNAPCGCQSTRSLPAGERVMVGTAPDGQLTAARRDKRVRFAVAGPEHDAAIRQLLRTPMHGAIAVAFEREPDYFRGAAIAGA